MLYHFLRFLGKKEKGKRSDLFYTSHFTLQPGTHFLPLTVLSTD